MTVVDVPGPLTSALTHCALFGMAAIIESATTAVPKLWWDDGAESVARLDAGHLDADEVASVVHKYAAAHTDPGSWVQAKVDHEGRLTGLFSPRIKAPQSEDSWRALQRERHAVLASLTERGALDDLRMISALGEPAYWRADGPRGGPDDGASRWEMKTRNRGEEFVGNRVAGLASAVANRTVEQVSAGLSGRSVVDELSKDAPDSRTATGLQPPGPIDSAIAWCALRGLSVFPVQHRIAGQSATAGFIRGRRQVHPTIAIIPVPAKPVTISRIRTLITAPALRTAGSAGLVPGEPSDVEVAAAKQWLRERLVAAVIRFPVQVTDNPSAPERRLLNGQMILTWS